MASGYPDDYQDPRTPTREGLEREMNRTLDRTAFAMKYLATLVAVGLIIVAIFAFATVKVLFFE